MTRLTELRYGENPHQRGAFYTLDSVRTPVEGIGAFRQHHGKAMSYVNFLDADAAYNLVSDFDGPAMAIIKHTNPACFAAGDEPIAALYERALREGDSVSAYGGIVASNRVVDMEYARALREVLSPESGVRMFYEIVIAPGFEPDALEHLKKKSKDLRILEAPIGEPHRERVEFRSLRGGVLVETADVSRGRDVRRRERAAADGGGAGRPATGVGGVQAREVERGGLREGRRADRHGRRPAEPRRQRAPVRGAGRRAGARSRGRDRRADPVPGYRGGLRGGRLRGGRAHRAARFATTSRSPRRTASGSR